MKKTQVKKASLNMKTMKKLNVKYQDDACLMKTKRTMKLRRSFKGIMKDHKPKNKRHWNKTSKLLQVQQIGSVAKKTHYDDNLYVITL
jgi:hypothetical protein